MKLLYNILNFDNEVNYLKTLGSTQLDVEKLYHFCSTQGLLPALHNAIVAKGLEAYFPDDFLNALHYITTLNSERNHSIITQLHSISKLFNAHNINYCYIKGAALLIANYYRDPSDRMIGDIDILVAKTDIKRANALLLKNGYTPVDYAIKMYGIQHRHLPRLIPEKAICAVELHHKIVDKHGKRVAPKTVLTTKQRVNQHAIPSITQMLYQTILTDQINDFSYHKWNTNFKVLYDYMVLTNKAPEITLHQNNRYVRRFLLVKAISCGTTNLKPSKIEQLQIQFLQWRWQHKGFNRFYIYLIVKWNTLHKLPGRFLNLFINPTYLKFSLNKLLKFLKLS